MISAIPARPMYSIESVLAMTRITTNPPRLTPNLASFAIVSPSIWLSDAVRANKSGGVKISLITAEDMSPSNDPIPEATPLKLAGDSNYFDPAMETKQDDDTLRHMALKYHALYHAIRDNDIAKLIPMSGVIAMCC